MEFYQEINFHVTKVFSSIIIIAFELKMSALINMVIVFFLPSIEVSKVSPIQPKPKGHFLSKKESCMFHETIYLNNICLSFQNVAVGYGYTEL